MNSTTQNIFTSKNKLSLNKTQPETLKSYQDLANQLLSETFNHRNLLDCPLYTITPTPKMVVALRSLFALINEDKMIEWNLKELQWISSDAMDLHYSKLNHNKIPNIKNHLKYYYALESTLRKVIEKPEEIISNDKLNALNDYCYDNQEAIAWLEENRNCTYHYSLIANLVQIVTLTLGYLNHLIEMNGGLNLNIITVPVQKKFKIKVVDFTKSYRKMFLKKKQQAADAKMKKLEAPVNRKKRVVLKKPNRKNFQIKTTDGTRPIWRKQKTIKKEKTVSMSEIEDPQALVQGTRDKYHRRYFQRSNLRFS